VKRHPRTLAVAGPTLVLALALGACGGPGSAAAGADPTGAGLTAAATPSPTEEPGVARLRQTIQEVNAAKGIVLSGTTSTDAYGTYRQITLTDDSPLLAIDPAVVSTEVSDRLTPDQLAAAHEFALRYLVSEGLDSTLAFSSLPDERRSWYATHRTAFLSSIQQDVTDELESPEQRLGVVLGDGDDFNRKHGLVPFEYADDRARVRVDALTLVEVSWFADDAAVQFDWDVEWSQPYTVPAEDKDWWHDASGSVSLAVQSADDGTVFFSGWLTDWSGTWVDPAEDGGTGTWTP
jgi:hypothetical protein